MYSQLYSKIQTTLDKLDTISKTYSYPTAEIEGYPAIVYYPTEVENDFASTTDNMKTYRFKMFIIVSGGGEKTMDDIFGTILSGSVDEVIEQFDEDWDGGDVDGHRCWILIDNGIWGTSETEDGKTAYAELNLTIRLQT